VNRAERWLHGQRAALRFAHGDGAGVSTAAGLEALAAAGALTPAEAQEWRTALADVAPAQFPRARPRAEAYLEETLAAIPRDPEDDHPAVVRFDAALDLFAEVGAADHGVWDARLRERAGWPTPEEERAEEIAFAAGRRVDGELVAVVPGPSEPEGGHRLLLALRFTDGVSFVIEEGSDSDWLVWTLTDDEGRSYPSDGDTTFRIGAPGAPRRMRLWADGHPGVSFEVEL
jgi:hypothetical protein